MTNKCHEATCNAGPALNAIHEQVSNAIEQGKRILEGGLDWDTFTRYCNELRETMVEFFSLSPSPNQQILQLREETKNVVELAKKMKGKLNLSSSVEDFIKTCENINTHIGQQLTDGQKNSLDNRLKSLNEHINDIGKIVESFQNQGVFSIETSEFLQSCQNIQSKLESHARKMQNNEEMKVNLNTGQRLTEFIKNQLSDVEIMTQDMIKEGVATNSLKTFLNACRDFRAKLEENSIVKTLSVIEAEQLANGFINSINSMLDIMNEMKLKGQFSDSLEEFVGTCSQIKKGFVIEKYINKPVLDIDKYIRNVTCHKSCQCDRIRDSRKHIVPKIISPSKPIDVSECDEGCDRLGFHETRVKKIITLKRYRDERGVMKEQTDTVVLKESCYDPTVNLMPEDVDEDDDVTVKSIEVESYKNLPYTYCSDIGGSSTKDKRRNKNKTVGYIVSVPSNQFKEVRKAKSMLIFRTTFSTELVKKHCMSDSSMNKGENVDDKNANLSNPWCNALLSSEMLRSSMELMQN